MDVDDIKPIIVFLILCMLIGFLWGYVIGNNKVYEEEFNILSAINSPVFYKTQLLGNIFIENGKLAQPKTRTMEISEAIIDCESGNKMIYGDLHLSVPSYGVAQFRPKTWEYMKRLSGMNNLDYYSAADQKTLLIWAIDNGLGHNWTCWNLLGYNKTYKN